MRLLKKVIKYFPRRNKNCMITSNDYTQITYLYEKGDEMKKTLTILLVAVFTTMLLASCASMMDSAPQEAWSQPSKNAGGEATAMPDYPADYETEMAWEDRDESYYGTYDNIENDAGAVFVSAAIVDENLAEKIIYVVTADIETIDFDKTVESVNVLLTQNGGFVETMYIGGRNYTQSYHGLQTFRTADYTLRIPKDRLNAVTAQLEKLGNVTSLRSNAENITSQFYDTQSRLNSFKTQEERLLDMLSKAEKIPDMLTIEERLGDIRYQIETLTSTLRNWQNQADYSYLNLSVSEVEEYMEIVPVQQRTYWQQVGDGFIASAAGVGNFFKEVFKWLVINLPVLLLLAVLVVAVVIIVKLSIKRNKKLREQNPKPPRPPRPQNAPGYPPRPPYQQYPQPPQPPMNPRGPQRQQPPQPPQGPAPQQEQQPQQDKQTALPQQPAQVDQDPPKPQD